MQPLHRTLRCLRANLGLSMVCVVFGSTWLVRLAGGDIFWHLRTGQWILAHHAIPTRDPFSYSAAGPWCYTEALAQSLYAGAFGLAGEAGLAALHVAVGVGIAAWVAARGRRHGVGAASVSTALVGASVLTASTMKPQVFSYLLLAIVLWILARAERAQPKALLWLPPLFLLWANLHRGGLVGLAALLAAGLAWSLDRRHRRLLGPLLATFTLCSLALLVNSGGWFYYQSNIDIALGRRFMGAIAEWQPLSLGLLWRRHAALLPLVFFAGLALIQTRRVSLELLVCLGTGLMAARSARLVPLFAIALTASAAFGIQLSLRWLRRQRRAARVGRQRRVLMLTSVLILASSYLVLIPAGYRGVGVLQSRVPVAAARFLQDHPPPARLWHSFDLGSYLLYALAPSRKVFIDGRNDTVYSRRIFEQSLRAPSDPQLMRELMAHYGIRTVVLATVNLRAGRASAVLDDPRFRLIYWDDVAAILVHDEPATRTYLQTLEYSQLHPRTVFQRLAHWDTDAARGDLATDIIENSRRAPASMRAWLMVALLERAQGRTDGFAQARARLRVLAAERGLPSPL